MGRRAIVAGVALAAVAAGVFTARVAGDDSAYSFARSSTVGIVALLGAGWLLVAIGLASWSRRRHASFGLLLSAAGFTWFLLEWNNPAIDSALAFTFGVALGVACPALIAHAMLLHLGDRFASVFDRPVVVFAYVANVLVLGVLPALLSDPRANGCAECPGDLLAVGDYPEGAAHLQRIGVYLGLAWSSAAAALMLWKLVWSSGATQRAGWPILLAGALYFAVVAATFEAWRRDGFLATAAAERRLWLGEAAALSAIALTAGWGMARVRRARSAMARLVVELARSTPAGSLRDVLADTVGDPALALAYPIDGSERLVDADGRPVDFAAHHDRTWLVREGHAVAVLAHASGALDDEDLVEEVTRAARLGLEHERLQAEVRARLADLRASRARIVAAGDAERRRLERDLHDGAQQRLVGLSLSLRLLRLQLASVADSEVLARLDEAARELTKATVELRELAHGIFPAVLADEGLAAAVEALAEEGRLPVSIRGLPEERFPPAVETAAYTVVVEASRIAAGGITVHAERIGEALVIEVETQPETLDLVELEDRIGAVDGRLTVERRTAGNVTVRAELPCAS